MRIVVSLCVVACLLVTGCPGGDDDGGGSPKNSPQPVSASEVIGPEPGGTPDPDGGATANLTITGKVTFDRLPVTSGGLGMTPSVENAANVTVEAVVYSGINTVLGSTTTAANGDFTLNFGTNVDYFVRARAQSDDDRVYHSQTVPAVVHSVNSQILNRSAGNQVVNLHASYDQPKSRGGAFAVLDTVSRLRTSVAGTLPALGPLDIFWAPGNAGTTFLTNGSGATIVLSTEAGLDGPNGNPSIYLLGGAAGNLENSDHDEYDETVIAHEWASFLQLTRSRDNNFGGPHAGEELLVTAAYSEGVVTAIGTALLGETVYRDTTGWPTGTTSVQFELDMESGALPGTGIGYGSEFEITRAVWDLFDGGTGGPTDSDSDPSSIAMDDFLTSFTDLSVRGVPYEVAWMASLLQELIDDTHLSQTDANTIMMAHGAQFPPAGGPDPFPEALALSVTDSGSLDAWSGISPNPILGPQANQVWRLELAAAQTVTIDLVNTTAAYDADAHRLDLTLHALDRTVLGVDEGSASNKSITVSLTAGTYIIRVQHLPASQADSAPTSFDLTAQ